MGISPRITHPLPIVILNAVKNQLDSPLVHDHASLLTTDTQVERLILHCVQNDKPKRVRHPLTHAHSA
jgi:hypothetical protein